MMYMPDAIRAAMELMEAPGSSLSVRTSYNIAGMSFTPQEIVTEIRRHVPGFEVRYVPDFRQQIADAWADSIDDTIARSEWGWLPEYDMATMTSDMLTHLRARQMVAKG